MLISIWRSPAGVLEPLQCFNPWHQFTQGCPKASRSGSTQCSLCRSVLRSIYSNFYVEMALNNSKFNIRAKGLVSPCTRSLKCNPKESSTGVGRAQQPCPLAAETLCFQSKHSRTAAEPSRWLAASPGWLIPLINCFTETYGHRSMRLLPQLIVGVKEQVSEFKL